MYEIIIFGKENFQGTHHHIFAKEVGKGDPNLFRTDSDSGKFSDQLNSVVVKSGEWGFYSDLDYVNPIKTISQGLYSTCTEAGLTSDNNKSIKLEAIPADSVPISEVILYDGPTHREKHHHLFALEQIFSDHTDLSKSNFDDKTSSLIIKRGIWEFSSDKDFGGKKTIFGPGMYGPLSQFNVGGNTISSAKLLSDCPPIELNEIVLYDHQKFGGKHHHIFTLDYSLPEDLNNKVYSVVVKSGRWAFYKDAGFQREYKDDNEEIITLENGLYDDISFKLIELEDVQSVRQY